MVWDAFYVSGETALASIDNTLNPENYVEIL